MKLLCKKSLTNNSFTPGKYYPFKMGVWFWYSTVDDNGLTFYWSKDDSHWYIWDYFYTPQETRKIKLEKLNETTL